MCRIGISSLVHTVYFSMKYDRHVHTVYVSMKNDRAATGFVLLGGKTEHQSRQEYHSQPTTTLWRRLSTARRPHDLMRSRELAA